MGRDGQMGVEGPQERSDQRENGAISPPGYLPGGGVEKSFILWDVGVT